MILMTVQGNTAQYPIQGKNKILHTVVKDNGRDFSVMRRKAALLLCR